MSKYLPSLLRLTFICFVFTACNKKSDVTPDSDSLIYITSENKTTGDNVFAIDIETGQKKWSALPNSFYSSSPVIDNSILYTTNTKGIYAFDAITGQQKWSHLEPNGLNASSTITVDKGTALAAGILEDSQIIGLDATTGKKKWSFNCGSFFVNPPTVVNDTMYIGAGSYLFAIDAETGQFLWRFVSLPGSISTNPAISNGIAYFGAAGGAYAIDAKTGRVRWQQTSLDDTFFASSPTVSDGTVYIGSGGGRLYALDAATGAKKWSFNISPYKGATNFDFNSSPIVVNGTVYVGADDHKLYAVDATNGAQKWAFTTKDRVRSSPCVSNGVVYVGSWDGNLYALDASTGAQKWLFAAGARISSSPAILTTHGKVKYSGFTGFVQ